MTNKIEEQPVKEVKLDAEKLVNIGLEIESNFDPELCNTEVYTHGSKVKKTKLEIVKSARMVKSPFLIAMQKKFEEKNKHI